MLIQALLLKTRWQRLLPEEHVLTEDGMQVNMSVAVIPMAAELGWSPSDRGLVSSAFFWGYSLTQIPAGWISTRYISACTMHCLDHSAHCNVSWLTVSAAKVSL